MITTILALLVTLAILVTVHEYGHYWVARRCGVKVLRFSIGFGKPLFSRRDRHGTEFVVAAVPLGGYVQMLDEREGEVAADELHMAFNRKPVSSRIAVVLAGPLANFLFAILAYWLLFVSGSTHLVPVLGEPEPNTPAWEAGLPAGAEIVGVDGQPVQTWESINLKLIQRLGETGKVRIDLRLPDSTREARYELAIDTWLADAEQPDPIRALGLNPWRPEIPARIGELLADGRAKQSGMQSGDLVLLADGLRVEDWEHWVDLVRARPEQTFDVQVERDARVLDLRLRPERRVQEDGTVIGYIGAGVVPFEWPEHMQREIRQGPVGAFVSAVRRTAEMSVLTLDAIRKMIEGLMSVKNLSGPITIAKVAGASANSGLESFIGFLAYLSVSLGVLNLLPIPVLDGGHLVYYVIELLKGSPVSQEAQWLGFRIGILLIVGIMLLAFYNDLVRL